MQLVRKENGEGIVYQKEKNRIWIALQSECSTEKDGCKGGCISCASRDNVRKTSITVSNPQSFELGQKVSFVHYVPDPNMVSLFVFGVPVLLAIINMLAWYIFSPENIESAPAIISTSVAFFSGFFLLKIVDIVFKKKYPSNIIASSQSDREQPR